MLQRLIYGFAVCFLTATTPLAAAIPIEMAGSYQALLTSEPHVPIGLVTMTVSSKGAVSGKLVSDSSKVYAFKTTVGYSPEEAPENGNPIGFARVENVEVKRGKLPSLTLALNFQHFTATKFILVATLTGEVEGETTSGFRIPTYAKGTSAPTFGSYTAAFRPTAVVEAGSPAGASYAVGKVDAKGALKLTGKTGDGKSFTASLPGGPNHEFFLFTNPYKRDGSCLAGAFTLTPRADQRFHVDTEESTPPLHWKKAGSDKDKSYRDGFGPIHLQALIEPWLPLAKDQTLSQLFDINPATEVFQMAFQRFEGNQLIPTWLTLGPKNTMDGKYNASITNPVYYKNFFSGVFTGKADPKTGKWSATFTEWAPVSETDYKKRKWLLEGVLLNNEFLDGVFGCGFTLVQPADPKTETVLSDLVQLQNIRTDILRELGQSKNLAGGHQAIFDHSNGTDPLPDSIPIPGATVTFTLSEDLQTVNFHGRLIRLMEYDFLSGTLSYSTAGTGVKNNLVVEIRYHKTTGALTRCIATYENTGNDYRFLNCNARTNSFTKLP